MRFWITDVPYPWELAAETDGPPNEEGGPKSHAAHEIRGDGATSTPVTSATPARRPAATRIPAATPDAGQNTATSEGWARRESPSPTWRIRPPLEDFLLGKPLMHKGLGRGKPPDRTVVQT